ncbi:MAG: GNAT family N-acetyltransferase [Haliea sp.]|nr:GNAT family N-acetyltransferase [Haliea sp.]
MALLKPLFDPPVSLIPFDDSHIEPLRAACAEDVEIWNIYPLCMIGEHFDGSVALLAMLPNWSRFAVMNDDVLVGMTNYIGVDSQPGVIEIGGTYIAPTVRGTNFNFRMKALLIEHAFANAFHTVEFKVDTRNGRSMHAVENWAHGALALGGTAPGPASAYRRLSINRS